MYTPIFNPWTQLVTFVLITNVDVLIFL